MNLYYNVIICVKQYVLKQNIHINIKMINIIMFYRHSCHLPTYIFVFICCYYIFNIFVCYEA